MNLDGETDRGEQWSRRAQLLLYGVVILWPIGLRLQLHRELQVDIAAIDANGLSADMGAGLLIIGMVTAARLLGRFLSGVLALTWVLFAYANYEYVHQFNAVIRLDDAAFLLDPTFVRGSASAIRHPALLLLCALTIIGSSYLWRNKPASSWKVWLATGTTTTLFLATLLVPNSASYLDWRQKASLHPGLLSSTSADSRDSTWSHDALSPSVGRLITPDLGGELTVERAPASNVLLLRRVWKQR